MRLVALFLIALAVRATVAWHQEWPGYIDATYYFLVARNLAEGNGFSENVAWNYVDHPAALPHPSNAYWMPFTSIVAAPFLWLFGESHHAAQVPFVLAAAALVPVTYALSLRFFAQPGWALLSAGSILGGGIFFPHWSSIDAWSIYPLIGTAVLALGVAASKAPPRRRGLIAAIAGIAVGIGHLTRTDGFLLFVPLFVLLACRSHASVFVHALLGYAAVVFPWMLRNVASFGRPLLGAHLVWLQDYADLFAYEKDVGATPWTLADWMSRIGASFGALFWNGVTLTAALQVVFLPCLLVALWTERRRPVVQAVAAYLAILLLEMSFLFPLAGPRGSFLCSLTAVIVVLLVLAPAGLSCIVRWVAARRPRWQPAEAERFFSVVLLLIGWALSANAYVATTWRYRAPTTYREIDAFLRERGEDSRTPVFCVDAPACHYWTGRPALAIPSDGDRALCRAAARFGARHLILEENHARYLDRSYRAPAADPRLEHLGTWTDAKGHAVHLLGIVTRSPEAC